MLQFRSLNLMKTYCVIVRHMGSPLSKRKTLTLRNDPGIGDIHHLVQFGGYNREDGFRNVVERHSDVLTAKMNDKKEETREY